MNLIQQFMDEANRQIADPAGDIVSGKPIDAEAFTFVGDVSGPGGTAIVYYGTFGDPVLMPVMTRQGWQDYLTTPLKVRAAQFATAPSVEKHKKLVRTQTGRDFFIQAIDYTGVVVYTMVLVDRFL
jgi:hypothetical protein